jgi:hypothetical protein
MEREDQDLRETVHSVGVVLPDGAHPNHHSVEQLDAFLVEDALLGESLEFDPSKRSNRRRIEGGVHR